MMMTEDEALGKWCPFAREITAHQYYPDVSQDGQTRTSFGYGVAFNRNPDEGRRCIASQCMAWRWADDSYPLRRRTSIVENPTLTVEPERPAHVPASWEWCPYDPAEGAPACWLEPKEEADKSRRGYCGLAGRPQS